MRNSHLKHTSTEINFHVGFTLTSTRHYLSLLQCIYLYDNINSLCYVVVVVGVFSPEHSVIH